MKIKIKKFEIYTCKFSYNEKRKTLCLDIFKNDKLIYKTQTSDISSKRCMQMIGQFNDEIIKEIISLEMEQL